jgi:hypothetical protein
MVLGHEDVFDETDLEIPFPVRTLESKEALHRSQLTKPLEVPELPGPPNLALLFDTDLLIVLFVAIVRIDFRAIC